MGYDLTTTTIIVSCRVSRHNDERDQRDDKLAEELNDRLKTAVSEIVQDPKYRPILPVEA
jgi:hypothetical protein